MIRPPQRSRPRRTDLAQESQQRLVQLLVSWGLASLGILSLVAAALALLAANHTVRHQADEFRSLASALVQSNTSAEERQRILLGYLNDRFEDDREGVLSLLLIDGDGTLVLSTRPSWLGRPLEPALLRPASDRDPQLRAVAACFTRPRAERHRCFTSGDGVYLPWSEALSLTRPFRVYDRQAGLRPRHYLLVVSFDPGLFTAALVADLGLAVVASALLVAALAALLAQRLQRGLLPDLQRLAETDPLTGLMNRSTFMDLAVQRLAQGQRQGLAQVLALLDIDHFRAINDRYGHTCGDEVLQRLARLLEDSLREGDLLTRLGGQEFAVLLQCDSARGATLVERLRAQVEVSRLSFAGRPLGASVSIGAAGSEQLGYNLNYLYSAADAALARAKREGRNRVRWANGRREPLEQRGWPAAGGGPAGNPAPGDARGLPPSPITAAEPPRPSP